MKFQTYESFPKVNTKKERQSPSNWPINILVISSTNYFIANFWPNYGRISHTQNFWFPESRDSHMVVSEMSQGFRKCHFWHVFDIHVRRIPSDTDQKFWNIRSTRLKLVTCQRKCQISKFREKSQLNMKMSNSDLQAYFPKNYEVNYVFTK